MYKLEKKLIRTLSCIIFASALLAGLWFILFVERASDALNPSPDSDMDSITESYLTSKLDLSVDESVPVEETAIQNYVIISKKTSLLSKANKDSEKILQLKNGEEAVYLSETKNYYQIKCSNQKIGWVLKSESELIEKEVFVKHIPKKPSQFPYSMADTKEGNDLCSILDKYGTVGASIAVIKNGEVAYNYEYGYANKEDIKNPKKVTENTKFRIASVSKVFTAMLAMAETDDGRLDLDGKLSDLFKFNFFNPKYPNTPVTMRMLLTHTAGLSGKDGLYSKYISEAVICPDYYFYKPGNGFYYSNLGMGLAGAVVEKASNQTISQYARDRFFEPMGIDASYDATYLSDKSLVADCYFNGRHKRSNEKLTQPQERKKGKPGEVYHLGQGGLLISAIDLARVSTILINDGQYQGKQYLSHEAVEQMMSVHPVNTKSPYKQCIGIRKFTNLIEGRDMYYHTGNYYGIYALLAIDPTDKSGVVIITSGANAARDDNTIFNVCNDVMNYCYENII